TGAEFNRWTPCPTIAYRHPIPSRSGRMSLPRHTDRFTALMARGNTLASQARYEDAIRCYDKILAKAPGHLDAINNRGNCLSLLGRFEQAIRSYNTILAARPNDLRARSNRAIALKQLGRAGEALAEFDRILEIDPNSAETLYHRGTLFSDL